MKDNSVTLAEVLESRDERAARQAYLLREYSAPLVSFTVVCPGPVKQTKTSGMLFSEGVKALEKELADNNIPVLFKETREKKTGNEALYSVGTDEKTLKRLCSGIEDTHRYGRLFDLDVISRDGAPVSRTELGMPGRKCLLCGRDAHACARSRAHSVEELQKEIERLTKDE